MALCECLGGIPGPNPKRNHLKYLKATEKEQAT